MLGAGFYLAKKPRKSTSMAVRTFSCVHSYFSFFPDNDIHFITLYIFVITYHIFPLTYSSLNLNGEK